MLWTILSLLMIPLTFGLYVSAGFIKYLLVFALFIMAVQLIALVAVTIQRVQVNKLRFVHLTPARQG